MRIAFASIRIGMTVSLAFIMLQGSHGQIIPSERNLLGTISFESISLEENSGSHSSVEWGDFDNDGDLDVHNLSRIFINQGNDNFSSFQIPLPMVDGTSGAPNFTGWNDFNSDGLLDICFIGRYANSNQFIMLENDGSGGFNVVDHSVVGVNRGSFDWGDLDKDGDRDLIITGREFEKLPLSNLYINENDHLINSGLDMNGLEGFGEQCKFGDFDSDGDLDFVVLGEDKILNNEIYVYENIDGEFVRLPNDLPGIDSPTLVEWRDFNGDGKYDFLFSSYSENSYMFLQIDKSHYNRFHLPLTQGRWSWVDIDNDGRLDLVSLNDKKAIVFDESFEAFDTYNLDIGDQHSEWMDWGDYDNDGDMDLLTGYFTNGSFSLWVHKSNLAISNNPPGIPNNLRTVTHATSVTLEWDPSVDDNTADTLLTYNVILGSSENDEIIISPLANLQTGDLLLPTEGNSLSSCSQTFNLPNEGSYFWRVQSIDNNYNASQFSAVNIFEIESLFTDYYPDLVDVLYGKSAIGDFDNDNDLDIFISGTIYENSIWTTTSRLYYNNGNGDFQITYPGIDSTDEGNAICIDFDNDDDLDIAVSGLLSYGHPVTKLYRNNGGYFELIQTLDYRSLSNQLIDADNDGRYDLITSYGGNGYIYVNSAQGYNSAVQVPIGKLADFDNDFDNDVLNSTGILRNNGSQEFQQFYSPATDLPDEGNWEWLDYDNDGYLDFILTGSTSFGNKYTRLHRNLEGTGFEELDLGFDGLFRNTFGIGDYNNDGFVDVILSGQLGYSNITYLYESNDGVDFSQIWSLMDRGSGGNSNWADIDLDGDLDLLINQGYGDIESILYSNNSNFENKLPSAPTVLSAVINGFDVTLSWDHSNDLECGEKGLSYNVRMGTSPGGFDIVSPLSDVNSGYRRVPRMGNAQKNLGRFISGLSPGTYFWSVQAIDNSYAGGSWATENSFTISNLRADFDADSACLGNPISFTDKTFSTEPIIAWVWDFEDGGGTSTEPNPQYTYGGFGEFDVSLIVRTASYEDSVSKKVVVKPTVTPDFTATEVCEGEATTFTNTTNTEGLTVSSWRWQFGDDVPEFTGPNPPPKEYPAGAYNVSLELITDNGCDNIIAHEVLVGNVPATNLSTIGSLTFCAGDSVTLKIDPVLNYEYEWRMNNIPILNHTENYFVAYESGVYKLSITNLIGNCTTTSEEYTISSNPLPPVPEIASENYIEGNCPFKDPVILRISNPSDTVGFQWKRDGRFLAGENNDFLTGFLEGGNYSVEVEQDDCISESEFFLIDYGIMPAKPELYAVGPNVWYLACSDSSAQSYRWYLNDKQIEENSYLHVAGNTYGKYQVSISNGGECYASSDPVWIPFATGIETTIWENLKIYPNPTPGIFSIEMENPLLGELSIDIFTESGQRIININFHKETAHFKTEIDLSGQPAGIYLVGLLLDAFKTTQKVVVE